LNEVKSIISEKLTVPIDRLTPDTKMGDLGAESLDIIEIVFTLEEKFGIDIPLRAEEASRLASSENDEDTAKLALLTIAGIAQVVEERIAAKA
jgi:acyl carrier protein